ncbi:MAG: hypothetical protein IIY16_01630 [Oscillospiraceae bacterium]|nr:hypothetical protein [Oscillospiraceae bacterium]
MKKLFRHLLAWMLRCSYEETEHLEGDPEEMRLVLLISYLSYVSGALMFSIADRLLH